MLPFQNDNITELDITELDVQYFKGVLKSRGDCKEHPYRSASTNFPARCYWFSMQHVGFKCFTSIHMCVCVSVYVCVHACMQASEHFCK